MGTQPSKSAPTRRHTSQYSTSGTPSSCLKALPSGCNSQPQQEGARARRKSALDGYAKEKQKSLPVDFSQKVIECEMELEKDEIPFTSIAKLIDVYMEAMSHYEAKSCSKYKYFEKKLQDLMVMPKIEEVMLKQTRGSDSPEEDTELRRVRLKSLASQVNIDKEAFVMVKSYENKEKEITKVLEGDLSLQKNRMKRKLTERKSRASSISQNVAPVELENGTDSAEIQQDGNVMVHRSSMDESQEVQKENRRVSIPNEPVLSELAPRRERKIQSLKV